MRSASHICITRQELRSAKRDANSAKARHGMPTRAPGSHVTSLRAGDGPGRGHSLGSGGRAGAQRQGPAFLIRDEMQCTFSFASSRLEPQPFLLLPSYVSETARSQVARYPLATINHSPVSAPFLEFSVLALRFAFDVPNEA